MTSAIGSQGEISSNHLRVRLAYGDRPIEKVDEGSRIALAQQLSRLPCLLTLCSGEDCMAFRRPGAFKMVHLYLPVIVGLLRGGN